MQRVYLGVLISGEASVCNAVYLEGSLDRFVQGGCVDIKGEFFYSLDGKFANEIARITHDKIAGNKI